MKSHNFKGPIFIIGMPRSGTKLLRDLLNQNPKIGIPNAETHFIPYMINRFNNPPDFTNKYEFDRFYEEIRKTNFWRWMEPYGYVLSKDYIKKKADLTSWSSVFEAILRFYAQPGKFEDFIWGDKSPTYLCYIKLLKDVFPEAKFLHIIRDPRDCSLSAKKVWGKSLYRTAELWRCRLEIARSDSSQLGEDYMEVLYENLLDNPERVLRNICDFLGCEFTPAMTELNKPSENLGDTKGQTRIVKENMKKYLIELLPSEIKRIEEIVYPIAKSIPYNFEYDVEYVPLSSMMSKLLTLYDGLAMVKFNIQKKGLLRGILYYYQELKDSSHI